MIEIWYNDIVFCYQLPDYHDVIKHPMDFATVRKKLAKGSYLTLKEFEVSFQLLALEFLWS